MVTNIPIKIRNNKKFKLNWQSTKTNEKTSKEQFRVFNVYLMHIKILKFMKL